MGVVAKGANLSVPNAHLGGAVMTGSLDDHAEALRSRGYTVIEGILDAEEVAAAQAALDTILQREARLAPRRNWHTDVCRIAYVLPQKHALFRSFCQREPLLSLMRAVLGPRCVVGSLNGFTMVPGGGEQKMHIDQPRPSAGRSSPSTPSTPSMTSRARAAAPASCREVRIARGRAIRAGSKAPRPRRSSSKRRRAA